ncbi:MAG: response regulator [Chloroflexota bacterium]|nr:response regulator [Chloroflexota bacterium]
MPRLNVLLIEQDPSLQVLYSDVLRNAGYNVYEITHDDDILYTSNMCRPAIALISGGPRGLFRAGWQAAEQLRRTQPTLPLIMIATNSAAVREVGQTLRGQSFVAALQKPFPLDELLAAVARYSSQQAHADDRSTPGE